MADKKFSMKLDLNSESNEITNSFKKTKPYDIKKHHAKKQKSDKLFNNAKSYEKKGKFAMANKKYSWHKTESDSQPHKKMKYSLKQTKPYHHNKNYNRLYERKTTKLNEKNQGTLIDPAKYTYFTKIFISLKKSNGFGDKSAMANEVLEQTESTELHLACNRVVSLTMEALIGFTDEENFERFMKVFSEELRPICSERFALNVLQKMIEIAFLRIVSVDSNDIEDDAPAQKKAKFLIIQTEKTFNLNGKFSASHLEKCEVFFLTISKFFLNNLEEFYLDLYTKHVIITTLLALGGFYSPKMERDPEFKKMYPRLNSIPGNVQIVETPKQEWQEILEEFTTKLQLWPHFADLPYHKLSSALLSNLLFAISHTNKKLLNKFSLKILKECLDITSDEIAAEDIEVEPEIETKEDDDIDIKTEQINEDDDQDDAEDNGENNDDNIEEQDDESENDDEDENEDENDENDENEDDEDDDDEDEDDNGDVKKEDDKLCANYPKVFQHESSCWLLETMLLRCDSKFFSKCYVKLFRERIAELSTHQLAHFSVQKLLAKIEISEFDEVFDSLSVIIPKNIKMGYSGVVFSLAQACLRLETKQEDFIKLLNIVFKATNDSSDLFIAVLQLRSVKQAKADELELIQLNGSLIVQTILKYNKPIQMVNSILSQSGKKLSSIFQTIPGGYCAGAFFESNYVGEKSKEKLVKLLEGNYISLATNKYGTRIFETIFKYSNNGQKEKIVKELATTSKMLLKQNPYWSILHKKLNVETYKMSPSAWRASLAKIIL